MSDTLKPKSERKGQLARKKLANSARWGAPWSGSGQALSMETIAFLPFKHISVCSAEPGLSGVVSGISLCAAGGEPLRQVKLFAPRLPFARISFPPPGSQLVVLTGGLLSLLPCKLGSFHQSLTLSCNSVYSNKKK